jgi:nucleotide-binding universal stress UspA family protein
MNSSNQILKNILLPIDGSIPSTIAQELTAFLAKGFNSKITVIHVIAHELLNPYMPRISASEQFTAIPGGAETPQLPREMSFPGRATSPIYPLPEDLIRDIWNSYHQMGEEAIANAVKLFKAKGISVDKKLVDNADPADTILSEAQKGGYDFIVLGHSEDEEKQPHLGSVAKKVLLHAPASVLIARSKGQVSKMLVPIDGSPKAERALQYAALLAKKIKAEMTLLYVQESSLFRLRPKVTKEIGDRILSAAATQVKGVELNQKLEAGDPAKVIIQTADKGNYDVIAMGGKGRGAVGRFLLGSVSDHVAHYATSSVMIIR